MEKQHPIGAEDSNEGRGHERVDECFRVVELLGRWALADEKGNRRGDREVELAASFQEDARRPVLELPINPLEVLPFESEVSVEGETVRHRVVRRTVAPERAGRSGVIHRK